MAAEQLRRALLAKGHPEAAIGAALARLQRERYVDDASLAARYAQSRLQFHGQGQHRVRQGLRRRGVAGATKRLASERPWARSAKPASSTGWRAATGLSGAATRPRDVCAGCGPSWYGGAFPRRWSTSACACCGPAGRTRSRGWNRKTNDHDRRRDPQRVSAVLRGARPPRGAQLSARPAERPHAALRQRRDEPVQGRVPGQGEARLHARGLLAEVRARRRQAQRPRERGPHRAPPHVLRDAGQLLLRRLLQEGRHRLRLGVPDPRPRPRPRTA